ncbi:MAG: hypothetical protein ACYTGB_09485 [Planctomycetota bacterium]
MSSARCKVAGCRRKAHARGLCQKHYDEKRKSRPSGRSKSVGRPPAAGRRAAPAPPPEENGDDLSSKMCRVPGCANAHHAKGYCKMHYGQLRRRGRIDESSVEAAADSSPLSMEQRLIEIKKRHELLKREIANIHKALESETDDDSSSS